MNLRNVSFKNGRPIIEIHMFFPSTETRTHNTDNFKLVSLVDSCCTSCNFSKTYFSEDVQYFILKPYSDKCDNSFDQFFMPQEYQF